MYMIWQKGTGVGPEVTSRHTRSGKHCRQEHEQAEWHYLSKKNWLQQTPFLYLIPTKRLSARQHSCSYRVQFPQLDYHLNISWRTSERNDWIAVPSTLTRSILRYGSEAPKMSFLAKLCPAMTFNRSSLVRSLEPGGGTYPTIRPSAIPSPLVALLLADVESRSATNRNFGKKVGNISECPFGKKTRASFVKQI